ncbi:N-6 DNA methylase [Sphingosinicella rhizophila]|uniref:site-specific DNA-methyltransferase (adenine-specific) n=1 Tax=Sphingosinicella rhizophila TaxID=3050082 RepID=A0ABU3QDM7_9SPHN|nr:N-6 DNA methylase [Sphingosinicella sp. GR2756]MDT9601075.1 N-6 DNA methylase [Sphingosinicella sp. GR2756]
MDAIYTPPDLAKFLAEASTLASPRSVADFAAGDGALLRAAAARWPGAKLFGSDIDEQAVASIEALLPGCDTMLVDFLADASNRLLADRLFDLILLNPPFSGRGNRRYSAEIEGVDHKASKALAFAARALAYLAPGGEIIAILPASTLTSERDAALRKAMRAWGHVEQIGDVWRTAFKSHAVAVTVLRITRAKPKRKTISKPTLISLRPFAVEMTRGSLSVHEHVTTDTGPRFIHTTDLQRNCLLPSDRRASSAHRTISGPAVLIPRVGRPSSDKVVLLASGEAVLSDCVIALQTIPVGSEQALADLLVENWESLKTAYGGSCASYTTLKRLTKALLRFGLASSIRREERQPARAKAGLIEPPSIGQVAKKRSAG